MGLMALLSRHSLSAPLPPVFSFLHTLTVSASYSKAASLRTAVSATGGTLFWKHLLLARSATCWCRGGRFKKLCLVSGVRRRTSAGVYLVPKLQARGIERLSGEEGGGFSAISSRKRMNVDKSVVELASAVPDGVFGQRTNEAREEILQSGHSSSGSGGVETVKEGIRLEDSNLEASKIAGEENRQPEQKQTATRGRKGEDASSIARPTPASTLRQPLELAGYQVEGLSVGGQETCIILPGLKIAFDIGRCPQRAVFQETLLISHSHIDHVGGVAFYVATRDLLGMKPPTVVVPKVMQDSTMRLMQAFRDMDQSDLPLNLIGLEVGEELTTRTKYIVRPFRTYHVIPSQGYLIYSVKTKLKPQFIGLPGSEIKRLKFSGVEIVDRMEVPEVAFTGDTTAEFITDPENADVLRAKLLIMETTFIDDSVPVEHARKFGHIHLSEVLALADRFQNQEILFIHFSARYSKEEILRVVSNLPSPLEGRVKALTERF